MNKEPLVSAIIPAAGRAKRLGKLPFSKELFPIKVEDNQTRIVSEFLIESMLQAGVDQLHFVIRKGKWDIPAFFGSKFNGKLPVCYHIAEFDYGVPFTVNQAYPFIDEHLVVLGFPDILFQPENAFSRLINQLKTTDVEIVLGIFPINRPEKWDMVELDNNHQVQKIIIKPDSGNYTFGWVMAAWKPGFTKFLNDFVLEKLQRNTPEELGKNEIHFGHAFIAALEKGMKIQGVLFEEGRCLDTGTPDEMVLASKFA
jgi:glucose-1-phosphate thymidylyltransferase